jgi:hypothetical protein
VLGLRTTSRAFCCADILCYFSPVLLLDKDRKLRYIPKLGYVRSAELQLIIDMSMRLCSEASIAENPLLEAFLGATIKFYI